MRKMIFSALMISLGLLLSACGKNGTDTAQRLQEHYGTVQAVHMTAQLDFTYRDQLRSYTLCCSGGQGKYKVEILAPEHLAGIQAVFDGEEQSLVFEDFCLDAGAVSREKLSPAAVLPRMLEALETGYVFESCREKRNGAECCYVGIDTTGELGKIVYAVWLSEENFAPVYVEVWVDDENIFSAEFTEFEFDAILS